MAYYMTRLTIAPTSNTKERVKAIAYFGNYNKEAALNIHKKNAYRDVIFKLHTIPMAVVEAKRRYFNNNSFIKIIL